MCNSKKGKSEMQTHDISYGLTCNLSVTIRFQRLYVYLYVSIYVWIYNCSNLALRTYIRTPNKSYTFSIGGIKTGEDRIAHTHLYCAKILYACVELLA